MHEYFSFLFFKLSNLKNRKKLPVFITQKLPGFKKKSAKWSMLSALAYTASARSRGRKQTLWLPCLQGTYNLFREQVKTHMKQIGKQQRVQRI